MVSSSKRLLLLLSVILNLKGSHVGLAQATPADIPANVASEFFLAFSKNAFQTEDLHLMVATPDLGPVNFLASSPNNSFSYVAGVTNGTVLEVDIPRSLELQSSADRNKGIRIHSSSNQGKMSVVALKSGSFVAGGYLALPSYVYPSLETYTYYGVSYERDGRLQWEAKSGILLVGSYNNTRVTITPSQSIAIPVDLRNPVNYRTSISAHDSYTFTIHSLQTFVFESLQDLTGTKVVTNKPMTFISSHECVDVPRDVPFCDHIVEQLPPTLNWGRFFLVTSLHTRLVGEWYKVVASKSSTSVIVHCIISGYIQPEANTTSITLSCAGQVMEFAIGANRYCSIQANKPVMLIQFSVGYSLDQVGDPFMLYITPVEQYSNNFTINAPSSFQNHISIVVPVQYFNAAKIYVHGWTIPRLNWSPVYCSLAQSSVCGYGTKLGIANGVNSIYHSDPEARIGVFSYGFEFHSAYGYPAGMELKHITDVCLHGDVRLITAESSSLSESWGRVEVCLSGVWSSICGSEWSNDEATVVCRQLGYTSSGAVAFTAELVPGLVSRPFTLTNVQCTSSESILTLCPHSEQISDCANGSLAYVQCQMFEAPAVKTNITSAILLRSPVTISCTVKLSFELWTNAEVQVTWSKDGIVLQNSSHVSFTHVMQVVGVNNSYQSNLIVDHLEEIDSGVYACTSLVVLHPSNHRITSTAIGAVFLNARPTSNQLIQLRLIGVGDCSAWLFQFSTPTEKASQVTNLIIAYSDHLCPSGSCGLTTSHFTDSAFRCFNQNAHEVTFRTRLHETSQESTMELVNAMLQWVEVETTMTINEVLLTVDPTCNIAIETFSEPECQSSTTDQTTVTNVSKPASTPATIETYTTFSNADEDTTQSTHSRSSTQEVDVSSQSVRNMVAVIGGSVAVIIVFILAILIAVISIACLCSKHKSRRSSHLPSADAVSAVSPFPPPAYCATVDNNPALPSASPPTATYAEPEKVKCGLPPEYMENEDQYWRDYEHSIQCISTTV